MSARVKREMLEQFAKNSKLLALLDEKGIERLAHHGAVLQVPAGSVVVSQGETGGSFYLIASGEVRVVVAEAGDKEVARLGPGMFFGEMAVITRQPRSATVETTADTELITFARDPVVQILRDYPKVREYLGSTGLARSEENISLMLDSDEGSGLAALLEGDDDDVNIDQDLLDVVVLDDEPIDVAPPKPAPARATVKSMGAPPPAVNHAPPPAVNKSDTDGDLRDTLLANLADIKSGKKPPSH